MTTLQIQLQRPGDGRFGRRTARHRRRNTPTTPPRRPPCRRFNSARVARWPSRDPIGESGGMNLYGFVYNNPINRFDRLSLDANTPSSTITPWELGWEWLTGDGPRHRDFGPGYYMAEGLRQHEHVKDSIDKMKTEIFFRCQSCKNGDFTKSYPYSLAGWGGVLKYLHDYSTLGTGGMTGNLVVTYLGSYGLNITASDIKCAKGTAKLSFLVNNSSTAASGTRPPVLGYTEWWQNNIAPFINDWFSSGGMSKTTQTFRRTENVTFDANHCCVD
ncbi:MAG TPA: RHS repeat-associated core domain-containing protein [Verrucomicrobiota bacterium]|nr:RHS repeat-associated core domain-containing protein [Verrucomicrobiota bacterium]